MWTFQCTDCHAIWTEQRNRSVCPNCAMVCNQSASDEISFTLSLLHQNKRWKARLTKDGKKMESIWNHQPTNQELGEWLGTITDPLWTE